MVLGLEEARAVLADRSRGRPLEVEIGCGNGHFITEYAAGRDETLLVGVDLKASRCEKAASKAARLGLAHVLIVCARAEELLEALPAGSVDAFHLYFPDPWPKSRHRRRRFVRLPMLEIIRERMKGGGRLYFATDFFDYYMQAKLLVLADGGFELDEATPPPQAFLSVFGRRFSDWGKSFHALVARRVERPAAVTAPAQEAEGRQARPVPDGGGRAAP
jgi:tRNA (guanine-N7-)-methyltransferase